MNAFEYAAKVINNPQSATLEVGSGIDGGSIFYWITDTKTPVDDDYWCKPIPAQKSLTEGEYEALIRGAREVRQFGYSNIVVVTNSTAIIDTMRNDQDSLREFDSLQKTAMEQLDKFDNITVIPYNVDMVSSQRD